MTNSEIESADGEGEMKLFTAIFLILTIAIICMAWVGLFKGNVIAALFVGLVIGLIWAAFIIFYDRERWM